MDEVYTCKCGCQDWVIGDSYLRCVICKQRISMVMLDHPAKFNAEQRELRDKEADNAG